MTQIVKSKVLVGCALAAVVGLGPSQISPVRADELRGEGAAAPQYQVSEEDLQKMFVAVQTSVIAKELAQSMFTQEAYDELLDQLLAGAVRSKPELAEALSDPRAIATMRTSMREFLPYKAVVDINADIYAKHFTLEELQAIGAFYRTSVGLKSLALAPTIMREADSRLTPMVEARIRASSELAARSRAHAAEPPAQMVRFSRGE